MINFKAASKAFSVDDAFDLIRSVVRDEPDQTGTKFYSYEDTMTVRVEYNSPVKDTHHCEVMRMTKTFQVRSVASFDFDKFDL